MAKKRRKLTDKQKYAIWCKRDWEGAHDYISSGYALGDFLGTEYEKDVAELADKLTWFDTLISEWEMLGDDDE